LEEPDFDVAEFDKLFSKAPAKVKPPASKSVDIRKVKVVSFDTDELLLYYYELL